jgi:hypothetical protein
VLRPLAISSVAEIIQFIHGPWAAGKRSIAVVYGYFDGSGTDDTSPLCCVAGFVADLDAWVDFDNRWNAVLDKPEWPNRVREVHMYDLAHAEKEFENWSYASRLALFGDSVGVITSSDIHALGSTVWVEDFDRLSDDEKQLLAFQKLGTPNDIAFQHMMQIVIGYTAEKYSDEKRVGVMFHTEPNLALRYHELYNHYVARFPRAERLSTPLAFGDSCDFPPLQAADLLAYTTFVWQLSFRNNPESYFPIEPAFLRMIQGMIHGADGGGYDYEALKKLLMNMLRGERIATKQ